MKSVLTAKRFPPYKSKNQYFTHVHQFIRDGDKFVIEHSLFGFGKTSGSSGVHVIDNEARLEKLQDAELAGDG